MFEKAVFHLRSIGLIGEYSSKSRIKGFRFSRKLDCMHLGSIKTCIESCGCNKVQPLPQNNFCIPKSFLKSGVFTNLALFIGDDEANLLLNQEMALLNIGASNRDDAFYRYKMPKMITKIEGRGNGIKTNIVNMVEIAKALARPASYITKFFGCELGAQSKFDDKTGTSLVNGSHETVKLSGLLEYFINKYVQCYGCKNPETEILITKTQMIELKCAACGFISGVDMRDKLTTFILKNPPETKKGSKDKKALRRAEKERLKEGEAADDEKKKLKKDVKKGCSSKDPTVKTSSNNGSVPKPDTDDKNDSDDGDDDIQWQTDTSMEAARRQIQEQLNSVTADMVMLSTDKSEKKTKTTEENGGNNNHEKLVHEMKALIAANEVLSSGTLVGSAQEVMSALYEAILCDTNKGYAKEAVKKKIYLAAAVSQGEEDAQMLLLRAIEDFCKKQNAVAVKEVALVLKALYDEDILEENYIVQWYEEGLAGSGGKDLQIWKNVKPFIEWLQSAESESEEE